MAIILTIIFDIAGIFIINMMLVSPLKNLEDCANNMAKFMQTTVLSDYNNMIEVGNQYSKDADDISDMINDFSATVQELLAQITSINTLLDETNKAVEESAGGVSNITEKNAEISNKTSEILEYVNATEGDTYELREAISRFKTE